ncbi:MAG: DNA gyrase subunit B [Acholeplasmatales bacterium]|jgi:DNA gyrase subunit B|nr:DNA gyrase subunit B [Acholeplasmatales bacterium]
MNNNYDADKLIVLEGLEHIKLRPAMYIGSTDIRGVHHLVWEIVDNSIDEVLAKFASKVIVELLPDNYIRITDDGRGIPVDIHPEKHISGVEVVFTIPNAGGKFDDNVYKVSGGLHGVGATVTNALSFHLLAEVYKDGFSYIQEFQKGVPLYPLKKVGPTNKKGTSVTFKPDKAVFSDDPHFDYEIIKNRLRQASFLNKGLYIELYDLRSSEEPQSDFFHCEDGLIDYIKYLNESKNIKTKIASANKKDTEDIDFPIFYVHETATDVKVGDRIEDIEVEVAFQYSDSYDTNFVSFANNVKTSEGGEHLEGFKTAVSNTLKKYLTEIVKEKEDIKISDTLEGLTGVISVKLYSPEFEGQTKSKLGTSAVRSIVRDLVSDKLNTYLIENPKIGRALADKVLGAFNARKAAEQAREKVRRKNPLDNIGFASKLADCRSKDPNISELYIVEGNSAGGSAKQGRDSEFQAILPLRGKVLNVEKAEDRKVFDNNELVSLIKAIGTDIKDAFDGSKIRYKKIIIMTDADVDGSHIRTLLLTFFFRKMRQLIELGYIYFAQPPLFKLQGGNKIEYVYSEGELEKAKEAFANKYNIQRYKGLGEMDPEQLWETTMDPKQRTILRVTMEEAEEAAKVFEMLMGEEVPPRKQFIQNNAIYVKNIDS